MNKIIKNKKGSAMVFAVVLIANALVIVTSVVFMSIVRFQMSEAISLTPEAFQRADSGMEYVLWEINQGGANEIGDICDSFSNLNHECVIDDPEATAFFFDDNEEILSDDDDIEDIDSVKVVGEAEKGGAKVTRSLRATLFVDPS